MKTSELPKISQYTVMKFSNSIVQQIACFAQFNTGTKYTWLSATMTTNNS